MATESQMLAEIRAIADNVDMHNTRSRREALGAILVVLGTVEPSVVEVEPEPAPAPESEEAPAKRGPGRPRKAAPAAKES